MAASVNDIGGLFYSFYYKGTYNMDSPMKIVEEVINALPSKDRLVFMVIHNYGGERLVYGYLYGLKAYGSIRLTSYNGVDYLFDVRNEVITQR